MKEGGEEEKLELGQIVRETGTSADWCNEIVALAWALERTGRMEKVIEIIKQRSITKYAEKYPAAMYREAIVTE